MALTPQQATEILNIAMTINVVAPGAMPESDDDKITEAGRIVELATQQMEIVKDIGEENVPAQNLKALKGVMSIANGTPPVATAPTPEPAPVPAPEPQAPAAEPPAPAPTPAPVEQPAAGAPPAAGDFWVDVNGGEWQITAGNGGPQVQARSVPGGEETVLPSGFLSRRIQAPTPAPAQTTPAPEQPALQPLPAEPLAPVATAPEPPKQLVIGENRTNPHDSNTYVLKAVNEGTVVVTDIFGSHEFNANGADWITWPIVEGAIGTQTTPAEAPPGEQAVQAREDPANEPAEQPSSSPAEAAQRMTDMLDAQDAAGQEPQGSALAAPVDDDEDDEAYGALLAQVTADYQPTGMPTPMDLERPPAQMPEDLTKVSDIENRAYHSQFNALAARARYLYGLEDAKRRGCDRIVKYNLKGAMRTARAELGSNATVTEVTQLAEDHELVEPWIRRRDRHADRADAYKTFLAFYVEDVSVLSRDYTMRAREEAGS